MDTSDYVRSYATRQFGVRDIDVRRQKLATLADLEALCAIWVPKLGPEGASLLVRSFAERNRLQANEVLRRWGIR